MRIVWHAKSIALQDDFVPCKANIAAKEQFIKAVFGYVTACLVFWPSMLTIVNSGRVQ